MKYLAFSILLVIAMLISCAVEEINTAPVIEDQSFSLEENSEFGRVIGQVLATDAENDELSFKIIMGNADWAFAIDSLSGELSVNNANVMDYEIRSQYTLTVKVSDGILDANASVHISIINQERELGQYNPFIYTNDDGSLPYQILLPYSYADDTEFPLLIFLHGSGERGDNNKAQLTWGGSLFKDSIREYPSLVVFPQCAYGESWTTSPPYLSGEASYPSVTLLEALIDSLIEYEKVDPDRVYVGGLSLGGFGTGQLLAKFPGKFAAGVVICGGAPLDYADELAQTPTSIYHGLADDIVPPSNGQFYFEAINDGTNKHRLTLYEGVDHFSWVPAFAEPDFLSWIYSHSR